MSIAPLRYYRLFHGYVGRKLYVLVVIMFLGSVAEGVGVTMFLPLLDQLNPAGPSEHFLNRFLTGVLEFLGVSPSFESVLMMMLVMVLLIALLAVTRERLTARILAQLTREVRGRLLTAYTEMDYRYYLSTNTGYLTNVITREAELFVAAFGHYAATTTATLLFSTYIAASVLVDWQVSALVLILGSLLGYSLKILATVSRRYSILATERRALLQQHSIQFVHYFKYLKATNSITQIQHRVQEQIDDLARLMFKLSFVGGALRAISEPVAGASAIGILFLLVSVMGRSMSSVLVLVLVYYRVVQKTLMVVSGWQKFSAVMGSIQVVDQTLSEAETHREPRGGRAVHGFSESIVFRDVSLVFEHTPVLEHIDLKIRKHQSVAIVGESGSGKSTLVDLVTGVLRPTSGQVLVDGVDYRELDLATWRRLIGYVTQENVVFDDSLANNISIGEGSNGDQGTASRLSRAVSIAYLGDVIEQAEYGLASVVGDRGVKLSGGQRQRLAIAREVFKEPELLILDEATSALDTESEEQLQRRIDGLKGTVTLIVIAHRLSTIKNCDYVYILSKGRIVEGGAYADLMEDSGSLLYRLSMAQARGRDTGGTTVG